MRFTISIFFCFLPFLSSGQSIDKGIGIVFLNESLPANENPKSDTMIIYKEKDTKEIAAKYTFNCKDRFKNEIISKNKLISNAFFEFDYETFGLPITKIEPTNDLAEVIYGYSENRALKGWVKINDRKVGYQLWEKGLINHYLYFSTKNIKFYKSPEGEIESINLVKTENGFDYIMKPLKTQGKWMLVKVITPTNYGRESSKKFEKEFWIKYLSESGRPLVWYYTRD